MAAPSRGADTLVLPASECQAWFRLYREPEMTNELGSPLGGVVYPVLYLRIGSGWAVDQSTENLTLTVTDNYEVGTVVTKTYADVGVSQNVWQGKLESATTWYETTCPGHAVNQATEPIYYRYCFPAWNSMTEPLGNNGQHTLLLTAPVAFLSPTQQVITNVGPETKAVEVANLVVASLSTNGPSAMFLLFDPDHPDARYNSPQISFEIRDDGDPHVYLARMYVRRTSSPPGTGDFVVIREDDGDVRQFQTGPVTYTWDGKVAGQTAPAGPYFVDVQVLEFSTTVPQDDDYSTSIDGNIHKYPYYTTYASHNAEIQDDGSTSWVEATYELADQDGVAPSSVSIWAVAPDLSVHQSDPGVPWPTALGTLHEDQIVYTFQESDPAGVYWVVLSGLDGRAAKRRDHLPRPILAVNLTGEQLRRKRASSFDQIHDTADDESHAKLQTVMLSRAAGRHAAGFVLGYRASDTAVPQPGAMPGDHVVFQRSHGRGDPEDHVGPCGGGVLCQGGWINAARKDRTGGGAFISDFDLSACRIVVWKGCHTADTHPDYGNIAWQTGNQGAAAAVGFHGETTGVASICNRYFQYVAGALVHGRVPFGGGTPDGNPCTIAQALEYAVDRLWDDWCHGRGPELGSYSDYGCPAYYADTARGGLDRYHIKGANQDAASTVKLR